MLSSTPAPFTGPLTRKIEEVERHNQTQDREIKELKEQLQYIASQQNVHQLKDEIRKLEQQVQEHKGEIESLKQQLRERKDQVSDQIDQKLQELQKQVIGKDKEIERLRLENEQLKTKIVEKDKELDEIKHELKRTETQLQDYMNAERKARRLEGTTPDTATLEELSHQILKPTDIPRGDSGISMSIDGGGGDVNEPHNKRES